MRAWLLLVIWIATGVVVGFVLIPVVGTGRAVLVPVGWVAGSVLGGIGGAVFTTGSRAREPRLKRTLAAAIGASMIAMLAGSGVLGDLAEAITNVWKLAIIAVTAVVLPPFCVAVSFWVNDVLR